MRECLSMWRNTRMVVLTAICAAAYVAVLLPFKGLVIIPGLTEVRPGAAVPVVLSFLFGPAAAWGAGFGNLLADALGGMLGPGSFFGFIGNFFYGYLPYTLWRAALGAQDPVRSGLRGWIFFGLVLVVDCLAIGALIGWGADLLGLVPFAALGLIIAANDLIASAVLASLLLSLLYERVGRWGLLYHQILEEEGPAAPVPVRARIGALLCTLGAILAFGVGLALSGAQAGYGAAALAGGSQGSATVALGMLPGLLLLLAGAALL